MSLLQNKESLNSFLLIISSYSYYKKEKKLFKEMVFKNDNVKNQALQELISSEKIYKRRKKIFIDSYPEMKNDMESLLNDHIEILSKEDKKIELYRNFELPFKARLVSFFRFNFNCNSGLNITYSEFSKDILEQNKIKYDHKEVIDLKNKFYEHSCYNKDLECVDITIKDLKLIFSILEQYVLNVNEDDYIECDKYITTEKTEKKYKERLLLARKIIDDKVKSYKKLYNDILEYKEVNSF